MDTFQISGLVMAFILIRESQFLNASRIPETTKTTLIYNEAPSSWNQAIETCNKIGGVLANIQDEVKSSAIRESLASVERFRNGSTAEEIWIGLYAEGKNSTFAWSTCETMSASLQKWDQGITESKEKLACTALNKTSELWKLRKCNEAKPYFCETYKECGCTMDVQDECADLSRTQYVNLTTTSLQGCLNLCLDYVSNSDQCWSISYFEDSNTCQIHEKAGNYQSTCTENGIVHHYHKNCYEVSIINHHNSGPSSNLEPIVDCELAERLTTLDRECNFTAESEVVTKTNEITTTENTRADCTCLCPLTTDTFPVNMTLSEQVDWLRTTLSIDRKGTALVKRSKISASDDRVSAQGLGYAGGIILILFLGGIVSLDLSRLFKDAKLGFKRCRRRLKMFVRAKAK